MSWWPPSRRWRGRRRGLMARLEKSSTVEAKGDLVKVQSLYEDPRIFRKDRFL